MLRQHRVDVERAANVVGRIDGADLDVRAVVGGEDGTEVLRGHREDLVARNRVARHTAAEVGHAAAGIAQRPRRGSRSRRRSRHFRRGASCGRWRSASCCRRPSSPGCRPGLTWRSTDRYGRGGTRARRRPSGCAIPSRRFPAPRRWHEGPPRAKPRFAGALPSSLKLLISFTKFRRFDCSSIAPPHS